MKSGVAGFAVLISIAACGRAPEPAPAPAPSVSTPDPSSELARIADDYLQATIALNPTAVYFAGLTDVFPADHSALPDNTPQAAARFEATEDALLAELQKIDPGALADRGDWVTWQSLNEAMEASVGLRVCKSNLWNVNHMFGWQTLAPRLASMQPVASEGDRAAALARWQEIPAFIAQERAHLEAGLAEGYSAPKSVVRRVIAQLDAIIEAPAMESPLLAFVATAQDHPDFQSDILALYEEAILPAVTAQRDFLRDVYLPSAREQLSISVLPNGGSCYEAMLRDYHSAKIGSQKTFDNGNAAVTANTAAAIARGEAMFGESDLGAILARVNNAADNRFESEAELISFTRALVPVTREQIAPFFSTLPEQEMIVEPYPEFLKGTGQPSRYEQKPAAEGPATYRIGTDNWADETRGGAEITAVHEGWPGHHLQIAATQDLELHPVTRLARSSAYGEGWARYSEALAEEAGVYESGYASITRRSWPARGMVVDTGLHAFGWTNEEALAFIRESGRFEGAAGDAMLDRIAAIPGQLTAYDTGGLEIFALRKEAEDRLGDAFDIREFHDRVLENGALPLGALREHVEAWIEAKEAGR